MNNTTTPPPPPFTATHLHQNHRRHISICSILFLITTLLLLLLTSSHSPFSLPLLLPPPPPNPNTTTTHHVTTNNTPPPNPSPSPSPSPFVRKTKSRSVSFVHQMDDGELLHTVSKAPYNAYNVTQGAVPKVAFMFLTRNTLPLAPLWEMFFKGKEGLYSIYVHFNPANHLPLNSNDSVFYGRRIPSKVVKWGNVNMIEAERRLLASALLDTSNQRFVLLSDSCIPLFNFSTIYSYLINSTKSSYIEVYDSRNKTGRGRYNSLLKPLITIRQWRKGSQWFEMDRYLAVQVVSDKTYFPAFQRFCKHKSCYADEHYLPTLVNIKFRERNDARSLTWVDWSKGGAHPSRFMRPFVTPEFLHRLRFGSTCEYNGMKSHVCHLFARKFTTHALSRLLLFAPKVMEFR